LGGGYFFVLDFRIKITRTAKAIIKDNVSYTLIDLTPFLTGDRLTAYRLRRVITLFYGNASLIIIKYSYMSKLYYIIWFFDRRAV